MSWARIPCTELMKKPPFERRCEEGTNVTPLLEKRSPFPCDSEENQRERGRRHWEYIFHHQHTLEDADLEQFAEAVGLEMQQYARALAEHRSLVRIEEDVESGQRSGVQGTPTFFINGVLYRGSWKQDALLDALQAASRTS